MSHVLDCSFQLLKSLGKNCRKIQLLLQATFSGPRKYVLITKLAQSMLVDTGWFLMRTGPTFSPSFRWNLFTNCTVTAEFYNHCDLRICCCCCCCWVASVASDSVRPRRRQPTRLPRPWDSPGRNTGVGCRFLLQCMKVKRESEVAQSYPTPSDPMDCSLPGSSVHGIFQARVLEWGATAFSRGYVKTI